MLCKRSGYTAALTLAAFSNNSNMVRFREIASIQQDNQEEDLGTE